MTSSQAAYRAGEIVSEIDHRFGPLTPACLGNCSRLPTRLPVLLRHIWQQALQDAAVVELLDGFDPPAVPPSVADQCVFWLGYYHQRTARDLPA